MEKGLAGGKPLVRPFEFLREIGLASTQVNRQTIKAIVNEAGPIVTGRYLGKIFQLSAVTLVLDFHLHDGAYLLLSADPQQPRLHLISRRTRELDKQSLPPGPFAQALRSVLSGAELTSIISSDSERIVSLQFSGEDETGAITHHTLLAQLTGRSANLLLLDHDLVITHALRQPKGEGQRIDERYHEPPTQPGSKTDETTIERGDFKSLSAAVDDHFARIESAARFASRVQAIRDRLRRQIAQKEKLRENLGKDLTRHGDPDQHKRLGDLLLANLANAERVGATVRVNDYFSEGAPLLEIEVDENKSLPEAANQYFSRYTKSKRARQEIATRMKQLEVELEALTREQLSAEQAVAAEDSAGLAPFEKSHRIAPAARRKDPVASLSGIRRYRSSDGYEILVGRAARTNDQLTFKIARPHDLWLHAADYPGSHVVVRNSSRNEIPQRTMIEAAQLAAKFSQASEDAKVNVHYAQRKFLSKPKGAAPGLVRMSSFKTITVAPGENVERI